MIRAVIPARVASDWAEQELVYCLFQYSTNKEKTV